MDLSWLACRCRHLLSAENFSRFALRDTVVGSAVSRKRQATRAHVKCTPTGTGRLASRNRPKRRDYEINGGVACVTLPDDNSYKTNRSYSAQQYCTCEECYERKCGFPFFLFPVRRSMAPNKARRVSRFATRKTQSSCLAEGHRLRL